MNNTAIILAGGLGTRLKDALPELPKSMADIGGKPLLAYILDHLSAQGITRVILAVGYRHEPILDYFGDAYNGMEIVYSIESEPLGTGGAIKQAFKLTDGSAFVMNGDTFFEVDLARLQEQHEQAQALISISLKPMQDFDRYATVRIDKDNRIIEYQEKQPTSNGLISGGIYFIDPVIFDRVPLPEKFSFETDLMEMTVLVHPYFGFEFDSYFIDVGIPTDLQRAQNELPARTT
jgi:D-glycero-alpha-D-manno-heptose 1-phosphate guanylyltransferase